MSAGGEFLVLQRSQAVRDSDWLCRTLYDLWDRYFSDTPRVNIVRIGFGRAWKNRLGSICLSDDQSTSYISINSLLRYPEVPDYVPLVTVAHEMVHYAHGFGSPLPRRYRHPHRGGIVRREIVRRGMAREYEQYDAWICAHWYDFYHARTRRL
ncbi:MAG: hypothetical protein IRY83_07085 [Chloroflexi bacterium]|nr:hypothetical protein [Chloroflexota bacterium]